MSADRCRSHKKPHESCVCQQDPSKHGSITKAEPNENILNILKDFSELLILPYCLFKLAVEHGAAKIPFNHLARIEQAIYGSQHKALPPAHVRRVNRARAQDALKLALNHAASGHAFEH